jgi:hypothetical protein
LDIAHDFGEIASQRRNLAVENRSHGVQILSRFGVSVAISRDEAAAQQSLALLPTSSAHLAKSVTGINRGPG